MKLSEYRGEKALDVLADLIEPAAMIMADKDISDAVRAKIPVIKIVKTAIKNHKQEVIEILAALDGEDQAEYEKKLTVFALPAKLIEIFNDPEFMNLFTLQGQKTETFSGSATESTKASEQ